MLIKNKRSLYLLKPCCCLFLLSLFFTFFVMLGIYIIFCYAPFGERSLVTEDAKIQYLDFFSYLKNAFQNKDSFVYTFGRHLGGTGIGLFSYYLVSPFNFLVLFFEKNNFHIMFNLLVALKLSFSAGFMSLFLKNRFKYLNKWFVILLSFSFALMQYNISQSSNIMWLDGVYMLPLMLLGIYKVVKNESPYLLMLSTGIALIFNWYIACVNCLFTAIWFVMEYLLYALGKEKLTTRNFLIEGVKVFGRYLGSMLLGIMISAFLFLPTYFNLREGRGFIDWNLLKNNFNGNIANIFRGLTLGSENIEGKVSLFCGSLVCIGCMSFFFSKTIKLKKKLILGGMLFISLMIFYWQPLYLVFSLLKRVSSYAYRCSYVTIFLMIFIAAYFFSNLKLDEIKERILIKSAFIFSALLILSSYVENSTDIKYVYYTCFSSIFISFLSTFFLSYKLEDKRQILYSKKTKKVIVALFFGVVCFEMIFNAILLMSRHNEKDVVTYSNYVSKQQTQLDQIKGFDSGAYRISQTKTYNMGSDNCTANYNEPLAYGYMSINNYDSFAERSQLEFINKLGYKECGSLMNIVTTSVLAADSLLGVKYILSDYQINGLESMADKFVSNDDKNVYANPYCLPMSIVYRKNNNKYEESSFYEFHNKLYSNLLGEKVNLYKPVEFTKEESDQKISYKLKVPSGKVAMYGNLPTKSDAEAVLHAEGMKDLGYSRWLSSSVFYIPTYQNQSTVSVTIEAKKNLSIEKEEFVALDLDELRNVVEKIKRCDNGDLQINGPHIKCEVTAQKGESLFLSVPYHKGWNVIKNGKKITPELFENELFSIPLDEGFNEIEMNYSAPLMKEGFIITFCGIAIIVAMILHRKKNMKK